MSSLAQNFIFERDPVYRQLVSIQAFDAWSGYRCSNSRASLSGGLVKLRLVARDEFSDDIPAPEPSHLLAARWLRRHEHALHDQIIAAIFQLAESLQAHWHEYAIAHLLPPLNCPDDLKKLIDLSHIDIFPQTQHGLPYFGFEFECAWDPEHGFHVLMNGLRVIQLDGDVSNQRAVESDGGVL